LTTSKAFQQKFGGAPPWKKGVPGDFANLCNKKMGLKGMKNARAEPRNGEGGETVQKRGEGGDRFREVLRGGCN